MNNANSVYVKTFAATQIVKFNLKATKQTSVTQYGRINLLRSPVNINYVKEYNSHQVCIMKS